MPEGDTIRRLAQSLGVALEGRSVRRFDSRLAAVAASAERLEIVGQAVVGVRSRGKHLLVEFARGAALHTHLGMHGRWSLIAGGSRGRCTAAAVIDTGTITAVCRQAAVVELLGPLRLARHPILGRLGPDLLAADFDPVEARRRLRAEAGRSVGEALLDQGVLAGIGNVYKSEVLFVCRVSPLAPVAILDDTEIDRLVATARRLMQRNLGGGPRRTTSRPSSLPLHVYRRAGQPCPSCGGRIERIAQGEQQRSTYYCPGCQCLPGSSSRAAVRG